MARTRTNSTNLTIYGSDGLTHLQITYPTDIRHLLGVSSTFAHSVTDHSGASARGVANITIAPDSLPPVTAPVSLAVAENANATAIGIAAPIDPNYTASQLTITATGLPTDGAVYLSDSTTSASIGQTSTAAQLTGLTFTPTAGAFS